MTTRLPATLSALAVIGITLAFADPAQAIKPVKQGSMRLSAERLVTIGLSINANAEFYLGLLPTMNDTSVLQYPRAGFDYFVIDGLSVGGSAGMSLNTGGGAFGWGILPRVGYAFDLSPKIEFWPRGGIGGIGQDFDGAGNDTSSAVLQLEGMFSYELFRHALLQFGPNLDVALASGWPVDIGGSAGVAIDF